MKNRNKFDAAEMKGRKALIEMFSKYKNPPQVKFSENRYESFDAMFIQDGITHLIEIKVRNNDYDTYVFEHKKYSNLLSYVQKNKIVKYKLLYLNFTPKAAYLWNVTGLPQRLKAVSAELNKSYIIDKGRKVMKLVYYLPIMDALKFDYQIK